jgi:hypothetical protein
LTNIATDFFTELLYGGGAWLYLFLILAIAFLVSWKVFWFSIISMVGMIFIGIQYIEYGNAHGWTNELVYKVILLFFSAMIFLYVFAQAIRRE